MQDLINTGCALGLGYTYGGSMSSSPVSQRRGWTRQEVAACQAKIAEPERRTEWPSSLAVAVELLIQGRQVGR